ncbi:His-Xaa-Ser system protein HxsD [Myroides odoratimimus]|uniref:His-Xaa-Ser system protein HxsD n=1 Tax=Myroides odoratimimus TaxID=76832 RepID=UPI0025782F80|nr:His-Xaa-Ser system protein HxsD [Myroides odoratimimus]MDM1530894.1 His-Xaa-Ser system protein HxsD [Myroides odoratimimus]
MIEIKLNKEIFSKDAIMKCLYWYTNIFLIDITSNESDFFLKLDLIDKSKESLLDDYKVKLNQDIIDFNLRDIITKETHNVRDLLIAKAFSHGEYDEEPPGQYEDSIGVNVNFKDF